jgi:hypothetical protein
LRRRSARHAAVKTQAFGDVRRDVLVAVEAERRLPLFVGAIVAERAGLFVFRVQLRDLAGHQQRLDAGRSGGQ